MIDLPKNAGHSIKRYVTGASAMTTRTPFPGIILVAGDACRTFQYQENIKRLLEHHYGLPIKPYCRVRLDDWLVAYGISNRPTEQNFYEGENGVSVIFEGYVTAGADLIFRASSSDPLAKIIEKSYRQTGLSFLSDLKGSFLGLIVDRNQGKAFLFNDRQGSRPMFFRDLPDGSNIFAPQVKFLAAIDPLLSQLNEAGVAQFLIRGCYYGQDTLYEDIRKFPQATIATFIPGKVTSRPYWAFNFKRIEERTTEEELLEEFDGLIARATQRLLRVVSNPILLLSGGLDSRLMLAYLLQEGASQIPTLSYRVNGTDGDDHLIAKQLSDLNGLEHDTYTINESDFPVIAKKEVLAVDGRVQVLDSPSNRWEYIGGCYDSIFIGDECFGWGETVSNIPDALDVVGWFNIDKTHRIADWLKPASRRSIRSQIEQIQRRLISESGEMEASNIKDKLYYTERMGNMLNGYGARRLWMMEQARPFLDEDIIEFISRLSIHKRQEKYLAWKLIQEKFPKLHSIPYSQRDSVPWWPPQFIRITTDNPNIYDFIVSNLIDNLHPQLAELFDRQRLLETIPILFSGRKLPHLQREWWIRFPGLWRFSQESNDRVGAVRGALRLLGLNLYLNG